MPPVIQASLTIIQLLEDIFKDWEWWGTNRDFYIHTLLPKLMADPGKGTTKEKTIILKIKKIASLEEWQSLELIADQLQIQKKNIQKASNLLDRLFEKNDFLEAETYVLNNFEPAILSLYEEKKNIAIDRIMKPIKLSLNQFDFLKAERGFLLFQQNDNIDVIQEYNKLVDSQQKLLVQETMSKIRSSCDQYNFNGIESLYKIISNWVSRNSIDQIIQDARSKQLEEKIKQKKIIEEYAILEKKERERLFEIKAIKLAEMKIIQEKRSLNIKEYCLQNKIINLIHFTKIQNLQNIIQNGLINRSSLIHSLDQSLLNFNDEMRLDGHPETICLSISFPNYKMFYKYNHLDQNNWVVLELDPAILWELDCAFCQENAASDNMKHLSIEKRKEYESLTQMFGDFSSIFRKDLDIPNNYPTHPQAEVLVCNNIQPKYIKTVHFKSLDSFNNWKNIYGPQPYIPVILNTKYFSPRKDYSKWKKNDPIFIESEIPFIDEGIF